MPYRHSVWVDVFGVVLFAFILLSGAGYLLSNMGAMTGGSGGGGAIASSGSAPAPQARPGLRPRRSAPASPSPSVFGEGTSADGGSDAAVPFSDGWQSQATPDLTGPTGSGGGGPSGAPSGGGAIGGALESEGPTIASRRAPSGVESRSARTRSEGSAWRSEARKLSSRVRALSSQLQQMEPRQERSEAARDPSSPPEKSSTTASGSGGAASASSGPGTPDDPPQVPIGGLGWLLATGVGYGAYRLRASSFS